MGKSVEPALRRTKFAATCVSPEELRTIDAHAASVGLSRSLYLRRAALKQNLRTRAEEEIARELIRIGVLLQQTPAARRTSTDILKQISQAVEKLGKT